MDLILRRQRQVIRPVGNQLMTKGLANFSTSAIQQEHAGHALDVAFRIERKMPVQRGSQHASDARQIQKLPQFRARQSESLIKFSLGIAEARYIQQPVRLEKPLRFLFRSQMHKRQRRALRFNFDPFFGDFRHRLAAKRASKMPQKHQEDRSLLNQRGQAPAALRHVSAQQSRIDGTGPEHGYAPSPESLRLSINNKYDGVRIVDEVPALAQS